MKVSNFEGGADELEELVKTMGNVALPVDFWDDFKSEVGNTDELHQNHEMLEKLT